jgi:hypothetical protein
MIITIIIALLFLLAALFLRRTRTVDVRLVSEEWRVKGALSRWDEKGRRRI